MIVSTEACCTLNISGQEQEKLVTMFKALGNPSRFEIMKYLVTHPGCITGDIVQFLPQAQATVSQHLKILKESGLIQGVTRRIKFSQGDSAPWAAALPGSGNKLARSFKRIFLAQNIVFIR